MPFKTYRDRSPQYWAWREAVLQRCNYECDITGAAQLFHRLEAHHLNSWYYFPAERYDPDNGIALTVREHIIFHEWLGTLVATRKLYEIYRPQRIRELLVYNR